jgi:4-hydroxy-4-methyl-2-oxoglutarate aldolase
MAVATPDHNDPVQRLKRLDTCAVSDALDKLKLPGAVTGLAPRSAARRIAGRVRTMTLGVGAPPAGAVRHLGIDTIESAKKGEIIVIEQRSGLDAACWGGILSLAAKLRGVAGVVADGPVRDVDEADEHGFPVFARSVTARTARGRIVQLATDAEVTIGDVRVNAGDYVIADRSAVVFLPAERVQEVLTAAEAIGAREAAMAKALLEGTPLGDVMGANYEHMLKE